METRSLRRKGGTALLPWTLVFWSVCGPAMSPERPNVLVLITDDQGYGELSAHGNPVVRTPHLDRLREESVRFVDFHVAPMCTPTRGQLLTGVDCFRNGAMNVNHGRTMLRREFPTLAEILRSAGYRTALFGKWHLGDVRPYRPMDRGFEEAVWFPSSQLGSVPDAWENDYFDSWYFRNERRERFRGYTTDVLFDEAMRWMECVARTGRPFFCYLATAAAHEPHYIPAEYRERVAKRLAEVQSQLQGFDPDAWYNQRYGWKLGTELASYLGMIENIDDNWGRMEEFLRRSGLRDHTLVIFLTDNGSTMGPRYFNAGMRGGKATLWEGGHRVPCFVRWPAGGLRAPGDVAGLAVVQDLLPTLVDLLGLPRPERVEWDGISLAAVLRGTAEIPADRVVVINFSRMAPNRVDSLPDAPSVPRMEGGVVLWRRWRWVSGRELYDLATDPLQATNVAAKFPQIAAALQAHLEQWWNVRKESALRIEHLPLPRVGEEDLLLTSCEWLDVWLDQQRQVRLGERKNGVWHIEVPAQGLYRFRLRRYPPDSGLRVHDAVPERPTADGIHSWPAGPAWNVAAARIAVGTSTRERPVEHGSEFAEFIIELPAGRTTLRTAWLDPTGETIAGAYYVEVRALGPRDGGREPMVLEKTSTRR